MQKLNRPEMIPGVWWLISYMKSDFEHHSELLFKNELMAGREEECALCALEILDEQG